ncbi:MAG: hypothetical protein LN561_06215 [Rickettsia endosymbiont of Labidopullus appendiculatus]|nr:hypothetical protein [Rickettsia endosymbiont of Labidopullus appendiculatus]
MLIISCGENIYPTEVECIIKDNRFIKNVCVLGIPDNYWGTIVCAVIQWQGNYKLSKMELREYCNNFMEKYKFPKNI